MVKSQAQILFLEDDASFRSRLERALGKRGHEVMAVSSCSEAQRALQAETVTHALLDLRVNGESGMDLIPRLLQHNSSIRIVVLTGFGSIASAVEAVQLGARDYLTKPADTDQVERALFGEEPHEDYSDEVPTLGKVEWEHIHRVMAETGGNISAAARLLGIDRRSLQRKLKKYPPAR